MTDKELFEFIDVEDMLKELGIRNVRDTYSGEIEFSCPFPGHSNLDSTPSAYMSTEEREIRSKPGEFYPKTTYHCFTCGARGTAITFLAEYEGISPVVAKRFLRERFAPNYSVTHEHLKETLENILKEPEKNPGVRPMPVLSEEEIESRSLNWFEADRMRRESNMQEQLNIPIPLIYMLNRGFYWTTLQFFEVGFDPLSSRLSIPVRNDEGDLVGFKGRAWWPDAKPKYKALGGEGYNFETCEFSRVLFGLNIAKKHVNEFGSLLIREGELNTMKLHEQGLYNACGLSGCKLSNTQVELIKKYASKAYVWFDSLEDSLEAARKLEPFMPVYVVMPGESDPADSSYQENMDAISSAESSIKIGIRQLC